MTATAESSAPTTTVFDRGVYVVAACGAASACVFSLLLSNDWCFTAVLASVLAAIASPLIDWVVHIYVPKLLPIRIRAIIALAVGLLSGVALRLNSHNAFETAFGLPPPTAIRDLHAERHFPGGPGEQCIFLRFRVDRPTLMLILKGRPFVSEQQTKSAERSLENHRDVVNSMFGLEAERVLREWRPSEASPEPVVYRCWINGAEWTAILWDPQTELAFVVYSLG